MSHLSDAQELNGVPSKTAELHTRINFAKFLVTRFPNTNEEIDADEQYKKFQELFTGKRYTVKQFMTGEVVASINLNQRNEALSLGLITYNGKNVYLVLEENLEEFTSQILK